MLEVDVFIFSNDKTKAQNLKISGF